MQTVSKIKSILESSVDSSPQRVSAYFKTGKGEYGQGDVFLGVKVPTIRTIAKGFYTISLDEINELISSKVNEERFLALIILVEQYKKGNAELQKAIFDFYLAHTQWINNWNLVDCSAHYIVGKHLFDKDRSLLFELAKSENMWERRIAMVSTWYFIRNNDLQTTFYIAKMLLTDSHDLIHKAVGWMLKEAGERDEKKLLEFLDQHALKMPRTMLRCAIEKLNQERRNIYLKKPDRY